MIVDVIKNNIVLFSFSENGNEAEVTRDTSQNHSILLKG
jgi:hypothetical protein